MLDWFFERMAHVEISVKYHHVFVATSAICLAGRCWDRVINSGGILLRISVCLGFFHEGGAMVGELFWSDHFAAHPWVSKHISHGWSCSRGVLEHGGDEMNEVVADSQLLVAFPEEGRVLSSQELVLLVSHAGLVEWICDEAGDHKRNSKGEKIDICSLVWLLVDNLRCHVHRCSKGRSVEPIRLSA